jgi:hypothetical protein
LAKIRKLGGYFPAWRKERRLVPVAAQPFQDRDIELEYRLVFPEALGIIGAGTEKMLLGPQVDA